MDRPPRTLQRSRSRQARRAPRALAWLILAAAATGARGDDAAEPAIVVEHGSGIVLHAEAADRPWFPASLAKMMTLYLAFEALEGGELDVDEPLPISDAAAAQPATRLGLAAGKKIAVGEATGAVATVSANDAAVVIAERLAGTEAAFARRMTERARSIGMTRTRFSNATGLPDERQMTTARDMAVLGRRLLLDHPGRIEAFARHSFAFAGRTLSAHNRMLGSYPGADGIKTGFTCASGFNIVTTSHRDGRRLIGVVLGGSSRQARDRRMAKLLDEGFAHAAPASGPSLAGGTGKFDEVAARPPVRLTDEACARFVRGRLKPGNLPGWGLLFGVFNERGEGRKALREGRRTVRPVAGGGIEVLLERRLEHGTSYKALLVGFEASAAGKACKALWERGRTCVVQSPAMMNTRGYELR